MYEHVFGSLRETLNSPANLCGRSIPHKESSFYTLFFLLSFFFYFFLFLFLFLLLLLFFPLSFFFYIVIALTFHRLHSVIFYTRFFEILSNKNWERLKETFNVKDLAIYPFIFYRREYNR